MRHAIKFVIWKFWPCHNRQNRIVRYNDSFVSGTYFVNLTRYKTKLSEEQMFIFEQIYCNITSDYVCLYIQSKNYRHRCVFREFTTITLCYKGNSTKLNSQRTKKLFRLKMKSNKTKENKWGLIQINHCQPIWKKKIKSVWFNSQEKKLNSYSGWWTVVLLRDLSSGSAVLLCHLLPNCVLLIQSLMFSTPMCSEFISQS